MIILEVNMLNLILDVVLCWMIGWLFIMFIDNYEFVVCCCFNVVYELGYILLYNGVESIYEYL